MSETASQGREGFTLVEAMVSLTITAIAGSALLLGIASSMQTTDAALEQVLVAGMAAQLLDEVAAARYAEDGQGPYQATLGPESGESGTNRQKFDDLDDFHQATSQPPTDFWGVALGTDNGEGSSRHPNFQTTAGYLGQWKQELEVYYVSNADQTTRLAAGQTSDFRAVHVRIYRIDPVSGPRQIVELRRIFAYVPSL